MIKVYIDGAEGTTGLKIFKRFETRKDIELLKIASELRKDKDQRKKLINEADLCFLCLPDSASIEAVSMVENPKVKIIDTSTAHRVKEGWSYGFPELSAEHRRSIQEGNRVAVPGCHATGFNALVYPLVAEGIIGRDYPIASFSVTGYSGGGKSMIKDYNTAERHISLDSPRQYALTQKHKHLKEMKHIAGLEMEPIFCPIVADYYSGMMVSVPLYTSAMKKKLLPMELSRFYSEYYQGQKLIRVLSPEAVEDLKGYVPANGLSGRDSLEIIITGNEERMVAIALLDNLGKGASGAAIQCMNLMLGFKETEGLAI